MARFIAYIEVLLKPCHDSLVRPDMIREELSKWIKREFLHLRIDQEIKLPKDLTFNDSIDLIRVTDVTGRNTGDSVFPIKDTHLDIQAYELFSDTDESDTSEADCIDESGQASSNCPAALCVYPLPNRRFLHLWDSLIFADDLASKLLNLITRMTMITRHEGLNLNVLCWNKVFLLYGPPGTGKTSLCRALAQKLVIRLSSEFRRGKLLEIRSHGLLSKWFGESGRLIASMFNRITQLSHDETELIVVLIDEVESVAANRERSVSGCDVGDAMRATNQLLTALDRLRLQKNVIFLCTSNMLDAIDPAFIDRVDVKYLIPKPNKEVAYNILRSCFNEMLRCSLIEPDISSDGVLRTNFATEDDLVNKFILASLEEVNVHLWHKPNTTGMRLWQIAQQCQNFSGRTLRRLPFIALALYAPSGESRVTIDDALNALSLAISDSSQFQFT